MRIDIGTLAFGYKVTSGGATPNWATSLGQGKEHKINNDEAIDELLKGVVYSSVPLEKISTKIGKGGRVVTGDAKDSPIILASLFSNVSINETKIKDGKFILLITRDTSDSHAGRLRVKYGPSNTYGEGASAYSNQDFFDQVKKQLSLADDACWFVSDIDIINQDQLVLRTVIVDSKGMVEYATSADLHKAWDALAKHDAKPVGDMPEGELQKWFKSEALKIAAVDDEAEQLYGEFRARFAPEVLQTLEGLDLLHRMFLNETDKKDSLCYVLKYDKRFGLFGSVAGGSAYKYGLFYSWDKKSWMTGSSKKQEKLTEEEAIEVGTKIRDELIKGAEIIRNFGELKEVKDYADLHAQLYAAMPMTISKAWVMMYFHMIFPELFPVFYNEDWQRKALDSANIEADENSFIRMGQIALFVKKCGISNVAFSRVLHSIESGAVSDLGADTISRPYEYESPIVGAHNLVIYGTPGCGKSYLVQHSILPGFGVDIRSNMIRTTFYQDYTNTDFVGQILPKVTQDKVTYEFNPGPFALALKKAIEHPSDPVALVIEELNRGNAASIFGDIFQLLDRDEKGKSEYEITNVNIQDYLNKCFKEQNYVFNNICIPSNLYIIATMNTSDQNVFTLDTAFKRRWLFEKIKNKFDQKHKYKDYYVPGMTNVTWQQLVEKINEFIVNRPDDLSSEDKLIGVYFIEKETLCEKAEDCSNAEKKKRFAYKLFEYIWDDVAKFSHAEWFGTDIKSLDQLIERYMENGEQVLAYVLK